MEADVAPYCELKTSAENPAEKFEFQQVLESESSISMEVQSVSIMILQRKQNT